MKLYVIDDANKKHEIVSIEDAAKILNITATTLRAYIWRKQRHYRFVELKSKNYIYLQDLIK